MQLEDQVTSLETSKKINNLLVEQGQEVPESLFHWVDFNGEVTLIGDKPQERTFKSFQYPAYTASELGEMLKEYEIETIWGNGQWQCYQTLKSENFYADTEAEARGKLLIYLLENNLM